jgi:RNA polymerase sigma factor (sigma-70 family)
MTLPPRAVPGQPPSTGMSARVEELFQQAYREHAGLVGRTARAFTASDADRDELFQDILIALWRALPHFRGNARLSTYVYRVAHSTALNWKRSRQRYARKLEGYATALPQLLPAATPRDHERLEWLYARIREMPPEDRTLILLYLDKVSYADIADITGLTESNIGVRLHRIKQQLSAQTDKSP